MSPFAEMMTVGYHIPRNNVLAGLDPDSEDRKLADDQFHEPE